VPVDVLDAVLGEEHVLGAAQSDAFGAELARHFGVARDIGIGAHADLAAELVGPLHEALQHAGGWVGIGQNTLRGGVGELVKIAVERGRKANPNLEIGICGEHGGEPSSVQFCYRVGMDYVSCSPFRVPIARLAAAQAAISGDKTETQRTA
jgi:hypothetical protein